MYGTSRQYSWFTIYQTKEKWNNIREPGHYTFQQAGSFPFFFHQIDSMNRTRKKFKEWKEKLNYAGLSSDSNNKLFFIFFFKAERKEKSWIR